MKRTIWIRWMLSLVLVAAASWLATLIDGMFARVAADAHHGLSQLDAFFNGLHQRASAGFNVQHNGLRAAGQLFADDAGGD